MSVESAKDVRQCPRCGAPSAYAPDAVVPGDPSAPRGSRRGVAHSQPAWACIACGYLEPEERRAVRHVQRQDA